MATKVQAIGGKVGAGRTCIPAPIIKMMDERWKHSFSVPLGIRSYEELRTRVDSASSELEQFRRKAVKESVEAMKFSCCTYSKYRVGACLLDVDGRAFTGCNVESASYGLCFCAERCALVKALSEGSRQFVYLACSTKDAGTACGACRQMLSEYCPPDMPIDFTDGEGNIVAPATCMRELLPRPFHL